MVDTTLSTSLQNIKGEIINRRTDFFTLATKRLLQRPDESASLRNSQELQPLRKKEETPSSHERPSWCSCGKCHPAKSYLEQLCCRRKNGTCITVSALFQQLVLSRLTLEFILLYKEPLLDLKTESLNKQLRHCSYKQYIHWRFGDDDLEKRAVIPNCCRWRIREAFPNESGEYSGFKKKH